MTKTYIVTKLSYSNWKLKRKYHIHKGTLFICDVGCEHTSESKAMH